MSKLNGSGKRKCESWIEEFIQFTDNLESSVIWRRWSAIAAIASVLEQKVWIRTSGPLYPNLYVWLLGDAGLGKTRAIGSAGRLVREIEGMFFGATSMTAASLVDHLNEAKRKIVRHPDPILEYNSLCIIADELSAYMSAWDKEMAAALTQFFDNEPYAQGRRVANIRIKILRPQLNMLVGTTPAQLMDLIPEVAWEQGLMSRVIMIYAKDRPLINIFENTSKPEPKDLIHDLKLISTMEGQFGWTQAYADAMHNWKVMGFPDVPDHPRLKSYCSRRYSHSMKLAMISAADRNSMELDVQDFNRALGWMMEAEAAMPEIFRSGMNNADSKAHDEIIHYVRKAGDKGVMENKLWNFARERIPQMQVKAALDVLISSGAILPTGMDKKSGMRIFTSKPLLFRD